MRTPYVLGLALGLAMLVPGAQDVVAQGDWELLPNYPDSAYQLWAQTSGAIFALGDNAVYRSDDLGDTWQALGAPQNGRVIGVDPVNDQTLYARATQPGSDSEALERSDDDGATWRTLLTYNTRPVTSDIPPLASVGYPPQRFAVSQMNDDTLYAYAGDQLMRSSDGGATWLALGKISQAGSPCSVNIDLLEVDTMNPNRIFTDAGCYAGRDFGFRVDQSMDGGTTFMPFFNHGRGSAEPVGSAVPNANGYPSFITGANGRWYLTLDPFMGAGPARLFRSDDDGGHWTPVWDTGSTTATAGGLAIDPNNPDLVYVAVGRTDDPNATGVQVSQDGGQSWTTIGSSNIGWVHDLARTSDGSALLAATNEGVWRSCPPA